VSAVVLDVEVIELLRDSPELLAIADAITSTQSAGHERHRGKGARWIGLAAAIAAAVSLALVGPWPGGDNGFAARALAALGGGQVIHVVSTSRIPGASVVDIRSGATAPIEARTEIFFDSGRHLERIRSIIGGTVVSDVLETPQGSWSSTGPVYTCAWIAAHPVQATRARVSCNISGINGTKPRTLPEPVPTIDPALAGFITAYRTALEEKRAVRSGGGVVDGRRVEWLRFVFVDHGPPGTRPTQRIERVAVDARTFVPVRVETAAAGGTVRAATIATAETLPQQRGQFARPTTIPVKKRPVITNVKSQRQVALRTAAGTLGGRLVWAGPSVAGLSLSSVKMQSIVTGYGVFSHVRPTHATGVELVYRAPVRQLGRASFVRLQESRQPQMLYGFFAERATPKEGTMRVETIEGSTLSAGNAIGHSTIWRGILVADRRYIQLETTSRRLLVQAARQLETR
jgi:hypothetical protein